MVERRTDRRAAAAQDALIRAAERLFGEFGVDAVSMRQVVAAAGYSNNFAVQYHFGDKHGLIAAIVESRLAELERRRRALLDDAEARGLADNPRVLADMIYRPIAEMRDESGRRTYAAFLLALQQSADDYSMRYEYISDAPAAGLIKQRLSVAASHVPSRLLKVRLLAAAALVLSGVVQRDRQGRHLEIDRQLVDDAIEAAAAMITAPLSSHVRDAVADLEPAA